MQAAESTHWSRAVYGLVATVIVFAFSRTTSAQSYHQQPASIQTQAPSPQVSHAFFNEEAEHSRLPLDSQLGHLSSARLGTPIPRLASSPNVTQASYEWDLQPDLLRSVDAPTGTLQFDPPYQRASLGPTSERWERPSLSLTARIWRDHANYYSPRNAILLAGCFGGGAVLANTQLDAEIHADFGHSIRNATSDEWYEGFHAPKELGNGLYVLPVFALAWGSGEMFDQLPGAEITSRWGERSLRAFLVGAPPVLLLQKVTGGGRPEEGPSDWKFWSDNNGVSGHSFMGALPFLTAARLAERPLPKLSWYAASTIVPLSRVSDGDHYASQALLGWCMALSATIAVEATDNGTNQWHAVPLITPQFAGIGFERQW